METPIAILIATLIAIVVIVVAKAVRRKNATNHWKAYLLATPGERNKVVWAGKPPTLATHAQRFVAMYEDTWRLVVELWPEAATRLAQFNRPRAFAECEAVLAPLTGTATPVDRFVEAYTMMAMITFDQKLQDRLRGADADDLVLDIAAKDYIRDMYGESTPEVEFGTAGKLVAARWQHAAV
jgi:hypothetical protein